MLHFGGNRTWEVEALTASRAGRRRDEGVEVLLAEPLEVAEQLEQGQPHRMGAHGRRQRPERRALYGDAIVFR